MPLRHHLDEVTEAQFKCDVPSHTQNDDLLVKVPSLEQILCRGRFRHRWQLSQDTEPFNSLHQNRLELKSDSFSYRTQLHSIPKLQHYLQDLTEGPSLQWNCLNRSGHPILPIELSCSSLLIMGASASDHFQSSFSLSAHHSLNSFLVFACSMSRATLYSQYRCHVSASMIRLVCSIALVRVAKAGSLSYLFPACRRSSRIPLLKRDQLRILCIRRPWRIGSLFRSYILLSIVPSLLLLRGRPLESRRRLAYVQVLLFRFRVFPSIKNLGNGPR